MLTGPICVELGLVASFILNSAQRVLSGIMMPSVYYCALWLWLRHLTWPMRWKQWWYKQRGLKRACGVGPITLRLCRHRGRSFPLAAVGPSAWAQNEHTRRRPEPNLQWAVKSTWTHTWSRATQLSLIKLLPYLQVHEWESMSITLNHWV